MITDNELYRLAIFLGSLAMLLIILYHFLEVNAKDSDAEEPHMPPTHAQKKGDSGSQTEKAHVKAGR
jgi:oligosaccharyl transferase complex subunit OST4